MISTTYADVHAGDVVRGHGPDADDWGVESIGDGAVTLVRHGERVTGYPPPGTPVLVVARGQDVGPEAAAWRALNDAGLQPEVISETWETA